MNPTEQLVSAEFDYNFFVQRFPHTIERAVERKQESAMLYVRPHVGLDVLAQDPKYRSFFDLLLAKKFSAKAFNKEGGFIGVYAIASEAQPIKEVAEEVRNLFQGLPVGTATTHTRLPNLVDLESALSNAAKLSSEELRHRHIE